MEADDPDRLVAENAAKAPTREEPQVAAVETNASAESAASEATAPAPIAGAREAPVAVAPTPGTAASAQRVRITWQKQLIAHLERFKRYPANGGAAGGEGRTHFHRWTDQATLFRPPSNTDRAIPLSTRRRSPCCTVPIPCRGRRP